MQIIAETGISKRIVYSVLRRHRPKRRRARRPRTSILRPRARLMYEAGIGVYRIAALLEVTPGCVYKLLSTQ